MARSPVTIKKYPKSGSGDPVLEHYHRSQNEARSHKSIALVESKRNRKRAIIAAADKFNNINQTDTKE